LPPPPPPPPVLLGQFQHWVYSRCYQPVWTANYSRWWSNPLVKVTCMVAIFCHHFQNSLLPLYGFSFSYQNWLCPLKSVIILKPWFYVFAIKKCVTKHCLLPITKW